MSSGDDEAVRIWNLEAYKCPQVIHDGGGKWGQITCMKWLGADMSDTLCFGTGRGSMLVYRQIKAGVCTTFHHPDIQ
jgi:WD40 repeat protein